MNGGMTNTGVGMMANRIIKDTICSSDNLNELSDFEFRLWVCLVVSADDAGRGDARPAIIKGHCFPLRERVTVKDIENALHGLAAHSCVSLYKVGGKPYYSFPTWAAHQRIDRAKPKFPPPENADENCDNLLSNDSNCNPSDATRGNPPQSAADCRRSRAESNTNPIQYESESNPNPKGNTARATRFTPPTVDDVKAYCSEHSYAVDAQRFVDYYTANGWMVGKNRMKDWQATVRTWASRDKQPAPSRTNPALNYEQRSHTEDDYSGLFIDLNDHGGE